MSKTFYLRNRKRKETPEEYLARHGNREHKDIKFIKNQLVQKNGAVCAICGKQILNKKDLTLDHIKPISKGGLTTIDNCQLACKECNLKKGAKWQISTD